MELLRNTSINKFLFLLVFMLIGMLALLFYQQQIHRFSSDLQTLKREHETNVKATIKKEIDTAVDYIYFKKQSAIERLREQLKKNVYLGHAVAKDIYQKYHQSKSKDEILELIKTSLRSIRFFDNRSYFYIYSMDGKNILHPIFPEVENTYQHTKYQDISGSFTLAKIEKLLLEKDEGYVDYSFYTTDKKEVRAPKTGYVKKLGFYDLYIGSSEYLNDFEESIKKEIFERLSKVRFGKDGYLFIDDFNGTILMHPMKPHIVGKNMIDYKDVNGVYVIKDLIDAAKTSSGQFVYYHWNRPDNVSTEFNKVSFARGIPEWKWMIGGGLYIDDINNALHAKEQKFKRELLRDILTTLLMIIFFVFILMMSLYWLNRRTARSFQKMMSFFEQAGQKNIHLDKNEIYFEEFHKLADVVNSMIEKRIKNEEQLRKYQEQLEFNASHDYLTLAFTRRYFMDLLAELANISTRDKKPLSVVMLDIDKFKSINDTFGHSAGDEVLMSLVKNIKSLLRKSDVVARFGGEEFVVMLPNTDIDGAQKIADKIRSAIEESKYKFEKQQIKVTASIGVSEYVQAEGDDAIKNMLHRVDKALYESKNSGRNKVSVCTE